MPMNMMKRPFLLLSLVAVLALSCDKDEDILPDPTPDPHPNTVVALQVEYKLNGATFDPSTMLLTDSMGLPVRVGRMRFFVSRPWFLDDNGDTVAFFTDRYLLMNVFENGTIQAVGEVDAHLHTLGFGLGIDSVTNHTDPTTFTTAPLTDATMHWGWNPANGYQFLQLEGFYESNGDGVVNAMDNGFLYHCGGDALLTMKQLEVHTDANMGGNVVITLECHMDSLFRGMDVAADPVSEVVDATTQRLMSNLSNSLIHP
jgi:hypothetical protein